MTPSFGEIADFFRKISKEVAENKGEKIEERGRDEVL